METKILSNGVVIPQLGFGTWKNKGEDCYKSVLEALRIGYRHIDTAWTYKNEKEVGQAIIDSGINRHDLFITTKRWNDFRGYEETKQNFYDSLKNLQLEYIDLYLLHWPKEKDSESWRAMEDLYREGKVRAIGVSNYQIHHMEKLLETAMIKPMVNQIEFSPRLTQVELRDYCKLNNIVVESWSPLMQGQVFEINELKDIAKKYNKTVAQVVLRFNIQSDVVVFPKSITAARIQENFDIFDFELDADDMKIINNLNTNERTGPDPDNFDF